MSFDFCYLDNESKINIKNQHVQYDFKDMLMMLQPESEHGGDFTIGTEGSNRNGVRPAALGACKSRLPAQSLYL